MHLIEQVVNERTTIIFEIKIEFLCVWFKIVVVNYTCLCKKKEYDQAP